MQGSGTSQRDVHTTDVTKETALLQCGELYEEAGGITNSFSVKIVEFTQSPPLVGGSLLKRRCMIGVQPTNAKSREGQWSRSYR